MIFTMNRENPKDSLIIFDNFQVDINLPKYAKQKEEESKRLADQQANGIGTPDAFESPSVNAVASQSRSFATYVSSSTAATSNFMIYNGGTVISVNSSGNFGETNPPPERFVCNNIFAKIYRWFVSKKKQTKENFERTCVQYVFDCVLSQPEKLKRLEESNEAYEKLIANAKLLGQIALVEELEANREVRKFENACVAAGFTLALTEKQLLTFSEKCEKGLKLDWIKNFSRLIPAEAVEKKIEADKIGLFDNYVVLYYDPENRCTKMTQKEIEKAKDPILFGVMRGSRKLYFIYDWKDELCDLTMTEVADKLGKKERLTLELP